MSSHSKYCKGNCLLLTSLFWILLKVFTIHDCTFHFKYYSKNLEWLNLFLDHALLFSQIKDSNAIAIYTIDFDYLPLWCTKGPTEILRHRRCVFRYFDFKYLNLLYLETAELIKPVSPFSLNSIIRCVPYIVLSYCCQNN